MQTQLLTVRQVAARLGIDRTRVYLLIRQGRITVEQIAGQYKIDPKNANFARLPAGRPFKNKPEK
jgi:excisionase family DNA binding protein